VAAWVITRREDAGLVDELRDHVRRRLGRHQYPRRITLVPDLPRTPNGKLDRRALRNREVPASPTGGGRPLGQSTSTRSPAATTRAERLSTRPFEGTPRSGSDPVPRPPLR
jgi:hypothetical protein